MRHFFLFSVLFFYMTTLAQVSSTNDVVLVKVVPVKEFRGKEYSLSVDLKSIPRDSSGNAQIFTMQVGKSDWDFIDDSRKKVDTIHNSYEWNKCTINGKIDPNAHKLWIYLLTSGNGDFYFDNIQIKIKDENRNWKVLAVENGDFEKSSEKDPLKGLNNSKSIKNKTGLHIGLSKDNNTSYNKSLHIHSEGAKPLDRIIYGQNPKAGKFINSKGTAIYYETYGSGEPLVLLHGNGGSIASFANQIPEFSKKYKVIAVDTRGQGKSTDLITQKFTYELFADDIKNLLDSLGLKQVTIVGWSDGGNTGLILASKYPNYVKKLVTMGANLDPSDSSLSKKILETTKKDLARLKSENKPVDQVTIRLLEMLLVEPNIKVEDLKSIEAQTLVMAGEKDLILENHTRFISANIPNATLLILKKQTHFVPEENPTVFNKAVLDFLNK